MNTLTVGIFIGYNTAYREMTNREMANILGVHISTIERRKAKGMTEGEILAKPRQSKTQAARASRKASSWGDSFVIGKKLFL